MSGVFTLDVCLVGELCFYPVWVSSRWGMFFFTRDGCLVGGACFYRGWVSTR